MTDRPTDSDLTELRELFEQAVTRVGEDRDQFLAALDASEPGLAGRLRGLLAQDEHEDNPLDTPLEVLIGALVDDEPEPRVGPYRIVQEVGRGGMGTVYLARRVDGEFEQRVAIKLVRRGMDSEEVLARFRAERQILASLEHPHIGRLYGGGVAEDGRPYLAMEFVEGEPITRYADTRGLPLHERVELFESAAAAVRFAHANLVVHRDLKPSNVMVTNDGTVKLLDFGIAKLLNPTRASSHRTQAGGRLLTPAYAAPEQVEGGPITTSTDVFSLGVLLHELLTGVTPAWKGTDPVPASSTARRQAGDPTSGRPPGGAGESGGPRAEGLDRALQGDLDAILVKALERDPSRRYASVDALIDDLQRYRDGRPVGARIPTRAYRLTRFIRRNRLVVGAAVAVVAALSIGLGTALHQRNIAMEERNAAELVTAYLEGMFESANPVGSDPGADTLRVSDFLERSTEAAMADLADEPELRARLLATLGRAHISLGNAELARDVWHQSIQASRESGEREPVEVLVGLGEAANTLGDWDAADSLLPGAIARARADGEQTALLRALRVRAVSLIRRDLFGEVDSILTEATALARGQDNPHALVDLTIMRGAVALGRGDLGTAMETQVEAVEIYRDLRGPDDLQVAITLSNLGGLQRSVGDLEAARRSLAEAVRIVDLRSPPGHGARIGTLNAYGNVLSNLGETQRADSVFEVAASAAEAPENAQLMVQVLANHSANKRAGSDTVAAVDLAARAASLASDIYGEGPGVVDALVMYGLVLDFAGDSIAAETEYAGAALAGRDLPPSHVRRVIADRGVARRMSRQGRHLEAETAMLELLSRTPDAESRTGTRFRTRQSTLRELAAVYRRWGRQEEAQQTEARREREALAAAGGNASGA